MKEEIKWMHNCNLHDIDWSLNKGVQDAKEEQIIESKNVCHSCGELNSLPTGRIEEQNTFFEEVIKRAIGKTITYINPMNELRFWEIGLSNGSVIGIDRFQGDGETRIALIHKRSRI